MKLDPINGFVGADGETRTIRLNISLRYWQEDLKVLFYTVVYNVHFQYSVALAVEHTLKISLTHTEELESILKFLVAQEYYTVALG